MAQFLTIVSTEKFKKQYQKLPVKIQQKFAKQLKLLSQNYRHPSLRTKKMGIEKKFEVRVDLHYRFTFELQNTNLFLVNIGPHDVGLGKK